MKKDTDDYHHQFSLFGFQRPERKIPISKERIEEVKKLIAEGKGKDAAIVLREIREKLENYSRTL